MNMVFHRSSEGYWRDSAIGFVRRERMDFDILLLVFFCSSPEDDLTSEDDVTSKVKVDVEVKEVPLTRV